MPRPPGRPTSAEPSVSPLSATTISTVGPSRGAGYSAGTRSEAGRVVRTRTMNDRRMFADAIRHQSLAVQPSLAKRLLHAGDCLARSRRPCVGVLHTGVPRRAKLAPERRLCQATARLQQIRVACARGSPAAKCSKTDASWRADDRPAERRRFEQLVLMPPRNEMSGSTATACESNFRSQVGQVCQHADAVLTVQPSHLLEDRSPLESKSRVSAPSSG